MQLNSVFNPNIFDNYVPYVGATMDLYLGSKNILTTGTLGAGATTLTSLNVTGATTLASLSGLLKGTSGVVSAITDNSANWNTAYTDRLKWDGGATDLVVATGRTSLGLGVADTVSFAGLISGVDATTPTPNTAGSLKLWSAGDNAFYSTFTAGIQTANAAYTLPLASTDGLLKNVSGVLSWGVAGTDYDNYWTRTGTVMTTRTPTDSLNLGGQEIIDVTNTEAFLVRKAGDTGDVFAIDTTNNCVGVNTAPNAQYGIAVQKPYAGLLAAGIFGGATNTLTTGAKSVQVTSIRGLEFQASYIPSGLLQNSATVVGMSGIYLGLNVTSYAGETKPITVTEINGVNIANMILTSGTGSSGAITATKAYCYKATNPTLVAGSGGGSTPTITTLAAFYDIGMTVGGTNWGFYGLSAQNYFGGVVQTTFLQTNTAPSANSSGTVAIVAKDANLLTNNAGWMPFKTNAGTTVYIPYWA